MSTNVSVKYTSSLNVSVTTRNGQVSRITTWVTGSSHKQTDRMLLPGDPEFQG